LVSLFFLVRFHLLHLALGLFRVGLHLGCHSGQLCLRVALGLTQPVFAGELASRLRHLGHSLHLLLQRSRFLLVVLHLVDGLNIFLRSSLGLGQFFVELFVLGTGGLLLGIILSHIVVQTISQIEVDAVLDDFMASFGWYGIYEIPKPPHLLAGPAVTQHRRHGVATCELGGSFCGFLDVLQLLLHLLLLILLLLHRIDRLHILFRGRLGLRFLCIKLRLLLGGFRCTLLFHLEHGDFAAITPKGKSKCGC